MRVNSHRSRARTSLFVPELDRLLVAKARRVARIQCGNRRLSAGAMRLAAARTAAAVPIALIWVASNVPALAYRPFDGTDAAITDEGAMEIELGPAGYLREGSERELIAPAVRLNYGFAKGWEAVIEGLATYGLSADARRFSLVGNAASLKGLLREGSLQDGSGPSVATEFTVLLPGINDEAGTGGSIAGIVSQQWPWITVHLNAAVAATRRQHGDLFLSAIVEGPHDWTVRPVAEVVYERDFGGLRTTSGLIGTIWQVSDDLVIDVGLRFGRINDRSFDEVRAGLTFSFPVR